jgi:hypothetical protein
MLKSSNIKYSNAIDVKREYYASQTLIMSILLEHHEKSSKI